MATRPLAVLLEVLESRTLLNGIANGDPTGGLQDRLTALADNALVEAVTAGSSGIRSRPLADGEMPLSVPHAVSRRRRAAAGAKPDLQVAVRGDTTFSGANVFNLNGRRQGAHTSTGFRPAIFNLRIENAGAVADSFSLSVHPGDSRWEVRVFDSVVTGFAGGNNVSKAAFKKGGWNTGILDPGQHMDVRLEVRPLAAAIGGQSRDIRVVATSNLNAAHSDAVVTRTSYLVQRQMEIRRQNFDASGTYLLTIQNLGNVTDRVRLNGSTGGKGFSVRYVDAPWGGADMTASFVGKGGWLSKTMLPGDVMPLVVRINAVDGRQHAATLRATSMGDSSVIDTAVISNRPSKVEAPGVFVIGAWAQPMRSFDKWQSRGINTMVIYQGDGASIDQWSQAAADRGLYIVRRPRPNPADDLHQANLLAWAHPDEPEISTKHPVSELAANYATWKKINPKMPIFVNFSGGWVVHWQGRLDAQGFAPYLAASDWQSSSIYPVTGWDRPSELGASGQAVDRLEKWTGGSPQFAVIECSDQELAWMPKEVPAPTPGQFRAQVWDSIIRGARGIIYFPQKFFPSFGYDNTPPEIVAEMKVQNARISALGRVLLSPSDPPALGAVTSGPLEVSWRFYGGKAYFIVLNRSGKRTTQAIGFKGVGGAASAQVIGENRTLSLNRKGIISDSFAPYETHVYAIG